MQQLGTQCKIYVSEWAYIGGLQVCVYYWAMKKGPNNGHN